MRKGDEEGGREEGGEGGRGAVRVGGYGERNEGISKRKPKRAYKVDLCLI